MSEILSQHIADALEAHGIASRREGGRVFVDGAQLAFDTHLRLTSTHPERVVAQVSIRTYAPKLEGRALWTVFAGVGADESEATADGFMKFVLCPFHVILSALGDHVCAEGGEEWRDWPDSANGQWRLCGSPFLAQGFEEAEAASFAPVRHALAEAFATQAGAAINVHWVSAFFADLDGARYPSDVQLDGEPWSEGTRILDAWTLPPGSGYRSGRYFFIALKAPPT